MARPAEYTNPLSTGDQSGLLDAAWRLAPGTARRPSDASRATIRVAVTAELSRRLTIEPTTAAPTTVLLASTLAALPTLDLATALVGLSTPRGAGAMATGQVATPPLLADLMAGWAVRDDATVVFDPACGAGGLLVRAAAWRAGRGGRRLTLTGVEADADLANVARLALAATGAAAHIVVADFLSIPVPVDSIPVDGSPTVEAVVANPPFVRHERDRDQAAAQRRAAGPLDARTDLHAYFWPALAARMRPGARAAVLTPASWLEADYGAPIRQYLFDQFIVEAIVEPAAERWFFGVGVHAVLVLARRRWPNVANQQPIRLIRLRCSLAALCIDHPTTDHPAQTTTPPTDHWTAIATTVARIDALTADSDTDAWRVRLAPPNLLLTGLGSATTVADPVTSPQPPGPQQGRSASTGVLPLAPRIIRGESAAHTRWPPDPGGQGRYGPWPIHAVEIVGRAHSDPAAPSLLSCAGWLRAPDALATLLAATSDHWARVSDLATVRYPLKSGADAFFYLTEAAAAAWGIEPDYLRPLVRSPRDLPSLIVVPATLPWRVLVLPNAPPDQLPPGVRRYIASGVEAGLDRRPTCAARRPWYALPALPPAPLLWPRFVHARHAVWLNPDGILENQTVYGLLVDQPATLPLAAILNSRLGALVMEVCGRGSLGDGALQYSVGQAATVPIPDPRRATPAQQAALSETLLAVAAAADWAPIGDAGANPARDNLDDLVLTLLGITDPVVRAELAATLTSDLQRLVAERHQRSGHRPNR